MNFNSKTISDVHTGFEYICLFVLIEAYQNMKDAFAFDPSWKENKFTKTLVAYIKVSVNFRGWKLDVVREHYLDNRDCPVFS